MALPGKRVYPIRCSPGTPNERGLAHPAGLGSLLGEGGCVRPSVPDLKPGFSRGRVAEKKTIRVLQIQWLLQRQNLAVQNLADRFHVSRRTIYRDLRILKLAQSLLASQFHVR